MRRDAPLGAAASEWIRLGLSPPRCCAHRGRCGEDQQVQLTHHLMFADRVSYPPECPMSHIRIEASAAGGRSFSPDRGIRQGTSVNIDRPVSHSMGSTRGTGPGGGIRARTSRGPQVRASLWIPGQLFPRSFSLARPIAREAEPSRAAGLPHHAQATSPNRSTSPRELQEGSVQVGTPGDC